MNNCGIDGDAVDDFQIYRCKQDACSVATKGGKDAAIQIATRKADTINYEL